jgi:acetyl-CoA synthetase
MGATTNPPSTPRPALLGKDWSGSRVSPNLLDYDAARRAFSWQEARRQLDGLPGGALNIAHEAVDRHVARGGGDRIALRWLGRAGGRREIRYAELADASSRFASVLARLGVRRGDRVFSLAGRIPELYVAALGTLKSGAVFSPLFAAFGPEPIQARLAIGEGRVLVTTPALFARKIAAIRSALPALEHVIVTADSAAEPPPGTEDWERLMAEGDASFPTAHTRPEDPALLHFTSGTTGRPKGALHVHEAVVAHHATGDFALDFHPDDVFWCTADPGWVTGTSYGIIAPLTHGLTSVVDEAEFDAPRWYGILERERVTVWYTAPTAVRMLMRAGPSPRAGRDLSSLRFVASVGEPLNPECVHWGLETLGLPIHDNWWQTETGGILIANLASQAIKPGSMGRPLPGIEAAVVRRVSDREVEVLDRPGEEGELAIRPGWPSMFRGYLHEDERYRRCFVGGWYLTGDHVRRDEDGYYWFVARGDDVIKSAGHLIGPFEVESALLEHPAVAEAAAIGKPDPIVGEIVKAFVALRPGHAPADALRLDLVAWARRRLGPAVAPREIAFLDALPRTRSGKLMRRLLRARELGLPEGDISTVETAA